jgi:hypothetical protein
MSKVTSCSIVIKDDFKNVFIVKKKVKKNEQEFWHNVGKKLKGRESEEKCISRAIKEDLKSIVFNVEKIDNIVNEENKEIYAVYQGELKTQVTYGNDIVEGAWVSLEELDNFNLAPGEKDKILMYYNK